MVTKALNVWAEVEGFGEVNEFLGSWLAPFSTQNWIIGTNVEYSIYVEFGTSRMDAQPYLFKAAREVMSNVESIWDRVSDFGQLLQRMAFRIEKLAKIYCPVDTGNLMASIKAEKL